MYRVKYLSKYVEEAFDVLPYRGKLYEMSQKM